MHVDGTSSTFGGPNDRTMSSREGLALVDDDNFSKFKNLFLATQPKGTTGLARRLDPTKLYIACRWDYARPTKAQLRAGLSVHVKNPANGKTIDATPVDWGPNEKTGRVADLSPGLASALGVEDNGRVVVDWP